MSHVCVHPGTVFCRARILMRGKKTAISLMQVALSVSVYFVLYLNFVMIRTYMHTVEPLYKDTQSCSL